MRDIGPEYREKVLRGRPKKKPEYDREQEISELIRQVVSLYAIPYDDRDERPPDAPSINWIAQTLNISRLKVRKLLITADYYSSEESRRVKRLHENGADLNQICRETGLKKQTVNSLLPYEKGVYKLADPPSLAENCKVFRKRKKACEQLREHVDDPEWYKFLWNAIQAFEQYPFRKEDGSRMQYVVHDECLCIDNTKLSREEVEDAFVNIREVQRREGYVNIQNCSCSEELYTIFLRIGACNS